MNVMAKKVNLQNFVRRFHKLKSIKVGSRHPTSVTKREILLTLGSSKCVDDDTAHSLLTKWRTVISLTTDAECAHKSLIY